MAGEGQGQESVAASAPPPGARPVQSSGNEQTEGGIEDALSDATEDDLAGGQEPEGGEAPEAPEDAEAADEPQTLDDLLGEDTPEEPEEPEQPEANDEEEEPEEDTGEEPSDEPQVRYRDPETGEFISEEEAVERGLEPEELTTDVEAAEDFFSEDEGESEEGEPDVEPVELELPGEEGSLEIQAEDEETREAVEQLQKDAEEGRQLRARVEELDQREEKLQADAEELDAIERRLQQDPSGFMLNHLADERREEVTRDLLLMNDDLRQKASEWVNEWQRNPSKLEVQKERRERERLETEYETGQRTPSIQRQKAAERKANRAIKQLRSMVPEDVSERRAEMFVQDAVKELQTHLAEVAQRKGKDRPDPSDLDLDELPDLVSDRLELYGFEAPSGNGDNPTDVPRAEPADEETEQFESEKAEEYRRTGERLRKAHARKRKAASTAPAGAGSTPSSPGLPDDADLDDALDFAERAVG